MAAALFYFIEKGQISQVRETVVDLWISKTRRLSQATACDGSRITATAVGQETAPGTLPIY